MILSVESGRKIGDLILETLFQFLLFGGLLTSSLNLIRELKLRARREVLYVVGEVIRRGQGLPAYGRLTSGEKGT